MYFGKKKMGSYLSSSKCYPLNSEFCAGKDDDSESDLDLMDYRSLKSIESELSDDSKSPKSMTTDGIYIYIYIYMFMFR